MVAKFLGSATLRASQSAQYDVNIQAVVASATPNPVARNTNTTLKATLTSGATPPPDRRCNCYKPSTTWLCPAATTNASGQVSRVVKVPNAAGTMPVVAKWMTSPVIQSPQLNVNIN